MAGSEQAGKVYVLVHGAFHGAWCWKEVAAGLRALGHTVYTPTLTGLGERSHLLGFGPTLETMIEDVLQVFRFEELRDVVLVGHSFAGAIVSALADRIPELLRHIVYLDAQILQNGQASMDPLTPEHREFYRQRAEAFSGGVTLPPNDASYYGITDPAQAAWLAGKLTPHPFRTYHDKLVLQHPVGNGLPATYIACSGPYFRTTAPSREWVRSQTNWNYLEIPTAHNAMTLMPRELTEMLAGIG